MIINIKGARGLKMSRKQNVAFGIQNWLIQKGYCLSEKEGQVETSSYTELLIEFCKSQEDFDANKVKTFETYENFTNKRFAVFVKFCNKKFKQK